MAIAICSSSNHSPTLPAISLSSLSTKQSLKTPHYLQYLSSPKFGFSLASVSDDALAVVAAAAEAVALASAAAQAARDAVASAIEMEKDFGLGERNNGLEIEWGNGLGVRRKKRRKRRKGLEFSDIKESCEEDKNVFSRAASVKSGQYLTRKQEAEYTLYIKEEARLEAVRRRILETSEQEPTSNQWVEAIGMRGSSVDKILCGGRESQERITHCYRRLVVSIAASYQGRGLSLQDLIQEGSIGLLRGARRFDPGRGYKLSTYVYWWIRQAVTSAIAKNSRIIRLPGSICEIVPKIAEANNTLTRRLRRLPSHDEIAQVVDVDVATVRLVYQRTRSPISLDQTVIHQSCMSLQDILPGPVETTPEAIVRKQQKKKELENILDMLLCEREAHILRLHYGLNGETPQSFEEIGRLLKLSRERVRQINRIALLKLQQSSMVHDLKVYMV